MGFKITKPVDQAPAPAKPWTDGSKALNWASLAVALLAAAWIIHQAWFPNFDPCPACEGTGLLSCGAEGCVHGRMLCTGPCLKKESPGWEHIDVAGHPSQELWMRFNNPDGTWQAWTQAHIGEAIEFKEGRWANTGPCTVCQGTTRMPCTSCGATLRCKACNGTGHLRHWVW